MNIQVDESFEDKRRKKSLTPQASLHRDIESRANQQGISIKLKSIDPNLQIDKRITTDHKPKIFNPNRTVQDVAMIKPLEVSRIPYTRVLN